MNSQMAEAMLSIKNYDRRRRLQTARHEAGHALVHILTGIPFLNVEIGRKFDVDTLLDDKIPGFMEHDGTYSNGVVRSDPLRVIRDLDGRLDPQDVVLISMSGIAGEQIHYKQPVWRTQDWRWQGGGRFDYEDAKHVVLTRGLCRWRKRHAYLRSRFFAAWELLGVHRDEHNALVKALLKRNILSYDGCVSIISEENR